MQRATYKVFHFTSVTQKAYRYEQVNVEAKLGVSGAIKIDIDSFNSGLPYFTNFLDGTSPMKHPVVNKVCKCIVQPSRCLNS